MRARLEVRACDPSEPERAPAELAESLLSSLPRRRRITLGVVGLGPSAGLCASPWVLAGTLGRLVAEQRESPWVVRLGDATAGETAIRKGSSRLGEAGYAFPSLDRTIVLKSGSESAVIPREIIGTSLVVVAPLVVRRGRGSANWRGPVASALAEFAALCRLPRDRPFDRAVAVGHRWIGETFANSCLILDATWAAAVDDPESESLLDKLAGRPAPTVQLAAELVAPERVLGIANLGRIDFDRVRAIDAWLAQQLGLRSSRPEGAPLEVAGSLDRWPHFEFATRGPDVGLAARAITGLRNQASTTKARVGALIAAKPRLALPARVPGRFASEWTRRWYADGRAG